MFSRQENKLSMFTLTRQSCREFMSNAPSLSQHRTIYNMRTAVGTRVHERPRQAGWAPTQTLPPTIFPSTTCASLVNSINSSMDFLINLDRRSSLLYLLVRARSRSGHLHSGGIETSARYIRAVCTNETKIQGFQIYTQVFFTRGHLPGAKKRKKRKPYIVYVILETSENRTPVILRTTHLCN